MARLTPHINCHPHPKVPATQYYWPAPAGAGCSLSPLSSESRPSRRVGPYHSAQRPRLPCCRSPTMIHTSCVVHNPGRPEAPPALVLRWGRSGRHPGSGEGLPSCFAQHSLGRDAWGAQWLCRGGGRSCRWVAARALPGEHMVADGRGAGCQAGMNRLELGWSSRASVAERFATCAGWRARGLWAGSRLAVLPDSRASASGRDTHLSLPTLKAPPCPAQRVLLELQPCYKGAHGPPLRPLRFLVGRGGALQNSREHRVHCYEP